MFIYCSCRSRSITAVADHGYLLVHCFFTQVRAVLTGGQGLGMNWALRIDDFVFSTVLSWMQEDGEYAGVGAAVQQLSDVSGAAAAAAGPARG